MGFRSRGNKPDEWASKTNHTQIINDSFIKNFIQGCYFPREASQIELSDQDSIYILDETAINPVCHILAVDGGYTTVEAKKGFPSS